MTLIVRPIPKTEGEPTIADEPGIGCYLDHIEFKLPGGKSHILDVEKKVASSILTRNPGLQPAMVIVPCRISADFLYAQCSFDRGYKEASGINNFLRKNRIVNFMRKHSVASLITVTPTLAEALYSLNEPRIEESLFLVLKPDTPPVRYELVRQQVLLLVQQERERAEAQSKTLLGRIRRFFAGHAGLKS